MFSRQIFQLALNSQQVQLKIVRLPSKRFFNTSSKSKLVEKAKNKLNTWRIFRKETELAPKKPGTRNFMGNLLDTSGPMGTMWGLIGVNVGVFLLWQTYGSTVQGRRTMSNNFTVSIKGLKEGRVWTLFTSAFSQSQPMHLGVNMLALYFLGSEVLRFLGPGRFLGLYALSGFFSSIGHLLWTSNIRNHSPTPMQRNMAERASAHGASGAIMATAVLFGCIWPRRTIMLNFFIPVPAWLLASGYVAYDIFGALSHNNHGVSNAGHLGGAAYGLAYYFYLRQRGLLRYRY
eukprot:TRINITY_DN9857_c0_g1_i1.p1 TRINITY_DN9857_c0_g1~~TRINITY_DN9857_c0_g1_i1.p1  ORF type:complete len:289 (+),score=41.37 TRINITY_DN9857_c0_g1_i1:56-922(+)